VTTSERAIPIPSPMRRRPAGRIWPWLGVVPFFLFALMFIVLPAAFLVVGSFLVQGEGADRVGLDNYAGLADRYFMNAFVNSIVVSLITAVVGGIFGLLLAASVILGGLPRILRTALMTFSGVASNFAGVPLALAFVFTLGNLGMLTLFLRDVFGFQLRATGFSLYTIAGLSLVYLYFQFPLMVLVIAPSVDGLRREWREAAENLGASSAQYWRKVALPILRPSILGAMILLFGNSFGAQATAFQLSGGTIPLATIVISAQLQGDVLHNPGLGYATAMGMIVIMAGSIVSYSVLQRRAERWLRQ
jgi:putative spermidine/putrescine transport system permease protein